ncbi:hypothetical protein [Streptomyces sp. NPDC059994]|uniref:hypothetical protein n=1 Tax=Streptomyces sp. NPDC059994 TaxID=3347029 RepID=UPI0036A609E6
MSPPAQQAVQNVVVRTPVEPVLVVGRGSFPAVSVNARSTSGRVARTCAGVSRKLPHQPGPRREVLALHGEEQPVGGFVEFPYVVDDPEVVLRARASVQLLDVLTGRGQLEERVDGTGRLGVRAVPRTVTRQRSPLPSLPPFPRVRNVALFRDQWQYPRGEFVHHAVTVGADGPGRGDTYRATVRQTTDGRQLVCPLRLSGVGAARRQVDGR